MFINTTLDAPLTIVGETLEFVYRFTNLGSVISNRSAKKDIENRLSKARNSFANLRLVWQSSIYSIRTKFHFKSVKLYGSECWKVVEADFHKFEAFHNECLIKICRIFWPNSVTNLELHFKTKSESIQTTIKKRRLRWLGHILRISQNRIPRLALRWTLQGKKKQGRPKAIWRRSVETEIKAIGHIWKWPLWKELVGGREWRHHASCGAKSKKKNNAYTVITWLYHHGANDEYSIFVTWWCLTKPLYLPNRNIFLTFSFELWLPLVLKALWRIKKQYFFPNKKCNFSQVMAKTRKIFLFFNFLICDNGHNTFNNRIQKENQKKYNSVIEIKKVFDISTMV